MRYRALANPRLARSPAVTPVTLHGDLGTERVKSASVGGRRTGRSVGLLVLVSLFVSTTPQNAHARVQDDALQRAQRATVAVETTRINGAQTGSGFVVTAEGVVVTSASLLKGAISAKVIFESGEEYPVIGMVTFDESRDLAVLRIAGFRLPTVSLLDSDSVQIGQQVLSLTAVSGNAATLSDGRVQGIQLVGSVPVLRTTLVGSSEALGAPILTEGGRLIGMTGSLGATDGSERIALPSNERAEAITTANAQVPTELADWEWDENASGTLEGRIVFASGRRIPDLHVHAAGKKVRGPGCADGAGTDDGDAFNVFGIGKIHTARSFVPPIGMGISCIMAPGEITPEGRAPWRTTKRRSRS